jgi:hypothetical protein
MQYKSDFYIISQKYYVFLTTDIFLFSVAVYSVKRFSFISNRSISAVTYLYKKSSFVFLVPTDYKYLTYSLLHTSDISLCTRGTPVTVA